MFKQTTPEARFYIFSSSEECNAFARMFHGVSRQISETEYQVKLT